MTDSRSEPPSGTPGAGGSPGRPRVPYADEMFALLDASWSAIVAVSADGLINYANTKALDAFGYEFDELVGRPVEILVPAASAGRHVQLREDYVKDARARAMGSGLELEARRKDGTIFPVEISLTPLPTPEGPWVLAGVLDVSARRAAEARVSALSRAHLALAELSAAILRTQDVEELYADACQVIHQASGRAAAWVGLVRPRGGIYVVARAGEVGPVDAAGVDVVAMMPALTRVVTEATVWRCGDVAEETAAPWADWARAEGVAAVVSLPLRRLGKPVAVLTVQASDVTLLEDELLSVLVTMADNLSFALDLFESQAQLRRIDAQRVDLLSRLVAAQEEERSRIAGDVHDHSIQALAAIDLRLGLLRTRLATAAPEFTDSVDTLQAGVADVTAGLRHLLFDLEAAEPGVSLTDQLHDAMEHVFTDSRTTTALRVVTDGGPDGAAADLPATTRAHAVRICKEALTNAYRHAQASQVLIVVRPDEAGVEVAVVDDGIGPTGDVATLRSARGHRGLNGMRDRAEIAGGWCRLERADEKTTLRFWLPRDAAV